MTILFVFFTYLFNNLCLVISINNKMIETIYKYHFVCLTLDKLQSMFRWLIILFVKITLIIRFSLVSTSPSRI